MSYFSINFFIVSSGVASSDNLYFISHSFRLSPLIRNSVPSLFTGKLSGYFILYFSNKSIKFIMHLFKVSVSVFVLNNSILKELVVVAKTLPDLSVISPLDGSKVLSLESLVFDISLYSAPSII